MDKIRSLVYRLGFRPKLGSIFFSPSREWRLQGVALSEAFTKSFVDASMKYNKSLETHHEKQEKK